MLETINLRMGRLNEMHLTKKWIYTNISCIGEDKLGSLGIPGTQLNAMTVFYISNLLQWDLPCFNPMDD